MRDVIVYLEDILEAISRIDSSLKGKSKNDYLKSHDLQDLTARRLEVIGEAAKNISTPLREKYSGIPWKNIAGTRDILIHAYFNIDLEKIWVVIQKDIPLLKKEVTKMLQELTRK